AMRRSSNFSVRVRHDCGSRAGRNCPSVTDAVCVDLEAAWRYSLEYWHPSLVRGSTLSMFAIRYSLRTFFGLIVVVSVSIALGTQWRYYDRLETRFIDPGSAEADALLAKPILATSEEI